MPVSGRSPGEGNDSPLQYPTLGKSHGQRSREDYSPCMRSQKRHDLATKQQQCRTKVFWFFFFIISYWSLGASQCCVRFYCTAE